MFEESDSELFHCQLLHLACTHLQSGESDLATVQTVQHRMSFHFNNEVH